MNGALSENRAQSWRFVSQAYEPLYNPRRPRKKIVSCKAFCLDVVQGHMIRALIQTRTHSWRFVSLAYEPLYNPRRPRKKIVSYKAFCLDVVQGHMIRALIQTRTHSWRFVSLAYEPLYNPRRPWKKILSCTAFCLDVVLGCPRKKRGCPRGVMVKALDCGIVVCEFVLQSRYYVHLRANSLGKGMNSSLPLILPAMD